MQYVMPFILAMLITMVLLPMLARRANQWLILDQPGHRKVHATPIPRVGGVAMALGILVAALLAVDLQAADRWFLAASAVLVVFGVADDRLNLDYRVKFIGQLIAVIIVLMAGDARIQTLTFDDRFWLPAWISWPLSAFFLVGVTNAVNLADGLDGLAGGTTFLSLCAVAMLSALAVSGSATALTLAFAGAVLGFLRFNTYPANVFMGDAGSQLLGFGIGVLSIRATQAPASEISATLPILLLAVPILDTLSVMVQRIAERRSPFSPDKNHIHHKMLALGFDHHEAVAVIYLVQGALFVVAYFLRYDSDAVILGSVAGFFAAAIAALQFAARSGWRLRAVGNRPDARASRWLSGLTMPEVLARLSYALLAAALGAYALLIVIGTAALGNDFKILIVALLAVIIGFAAALRGAPLNVVEKGALYITATVLVYLEAMVFPANRLLSVLAWIAVGLAAAATAVRLRLDNDRRFELTPLDLIVLFMALVVPNLPGSLHLPHGGASAIAKLVIIFYALEMLIVPAPPRIVWLRLGAASILAGLFLRSLPGFA